MHETCARSAAETKMGYLISLLVAPCFQGTDHALLTDVSLGRTPSIPTAEWLHQRKEVTVGGFDGRGSGRSGCTQGAAGPSPLTLCTV